MFVWFSPINSEVNAMSLPPSRTFVRLIIDEMKSLVYSGQVTGFINVGDINNDLLKLEETPQMAKQVLVIFFNLSFPYAHFGTDGIIANLLFSIVWEARLEVKKLKVISVMVQASANRKLVKDAP